MPSPVDQAKTVKIGTATTDKVQRLAVTPARSSLAGTSPLSAEELQRRQDAVRKTRRPAGPQPRTNSAVVTDEAIPDVEETDCEERSPE